MDRRSDEVSSGTESRAPSRLLAGHRRRASRPSWGGLGTDALLARLAVVYAPVVLVGLGLVAFYTSISPGALTRDPAAIAGIPFYSGALSTLGIILWSCAAAVCLLTYGVLSAVPGRISTGRFFLGAGLLTLGLVVDDAFMIHEAVVPEYLGISGSYVYLVHATAAALLFSVFRTVVVEAESVLLATCIAAFAASILIDLLHDRLGISFYGSSFAEDGFKLLGIAGWLGYFAARSRHEIRALIGEAAAAV